MLGIVDALVWPTIRVQIEVMAAVPPGRSAAPTSPANPIRLP
jgi:hypothetical protein